MTRDFSDETKEELLKNIDEEYNISVFNGPPMGEGNLAEDLYNLINTPWLTLFALDGVLTAKNIAAKREIEAIWEEVYKVAGTYDTKIQHLYSLAEALKKKIEYITVTLTPTGAGDTGYAVIDSLPEEFQAGFTVVNNAVNNAKNTMTEYLLEEMLIRNDNGEIVDYDYDVISELMDKNADDITSVEYKALAYAFIGDGSISDDAHDKHVEVQNLIINGCYDVYRKEKTYLGDDEIYILSCKPNEKFELLYSSVCDIQNEILSIDANRESVKHERIIERGIYYNLAQNKVVLDLLNSSSQSIMCMSQYEDDDIFPIQISATGNGDGPLKVSFIEEKRQTFLTGDSVYTSSYIRVPQSYMISEVKYRNDISYFQRDELKYVIKESGMLNKPSFFQVLRGISFDASTSVVTSVIKDIKTGIIVDIGISTLVNVAEYNNDVDQYEKNVENVRNMYSNMSDLEMAQKYGLGVVEIRNEYSEKIEYCYIEGIGGSDLEAIPSTRKIIENINNNLVLEGINQVTISDVMKMSNKIYLYDFMINWFKADPESGKENYSFYNLTF